MCSPECDFSVFWPAGLLARRGELNTIYNPALFLSSRQHLFTPHIDPLSWYYPPPALLAVMPVSFLPFETGFLVWSLILTLLAIALLRLAALPWLAIAACMISPAALWNFELGQFGALTGAACAGGLYMVSEAPLAASAVLALLVLKPQAGLLVPVMFLAAGNWRGVISCALTVFAILAVVTSVLGWQVWHEFLASGIAASNIVLLNPDVSGSAKFGTSVFWMLRNFGATLSVSYAAQSLATLASACLTWVVWRGGRFTRVERMALTVFLSLLATPYGYTDDMVAWSIALAALAQARGWRINLLDALFWLWPALCPVVFMKTGMLFTPIVVLAAILRMRPLWPRGTAVLPRPV